jgi:hypothetical protein
MAREVERLLKKLPGADPTLRGDPDDPPPRPPGSSSGPRPAVPPLRRAGPTPVERAGVWALAAGAGVLGAALTQWPYRTDCGWRLYVYLGAVLAVLLTAGWAAMAAWRLRVPTAHVLALVSGFFGIVLAAQEILPRVGYAAESRVWQCQVAPPRVVRPAPRPVPAAPADSIAAPRDSGR